VKLSRWTIPLYVGLIFASGAVVGAYSHRFIDVTAVSANARTNPEEFRKLFRAEMKSRLHLTTEQQSKLSTVLDSTHAEFDSTRASIVPELNRIRDEQHRRILTILEPGQQAEYEKMRQEREARTRQNDAAPPSR
jgi:hypothetical protein